MSTSKQVNTSDYGFWFYPPESRQAPGGNRLDMFINDAPGSQLFDLKNVRLPVLVDKGIETLSIYHPWQYKHQYHVCPGIVELIDRNGEKEEAYTFGGNLSIQTQGTTTTCTLSSSAPILHIFADDKMRTMLIEEIEILIAERRATLSPAEYEQRLIDVDALSLYVACINTLAKNYEHHSHQEDPQILPFINFLHAEKTRLEEEGLSQGLPASLEEVL